MLCDEEVELGTQALLVECNSHFCNEICWKRRWRIFLSHIWSHECGKFMAHLFGNLFLATMLMFDI
ncbi:hypothetical protein DVH24_015995 [Malus domestica]|uniref:Uncharacterized protein n=1 Tax=Malus domestica TaxID=3750 RepID=A0A498JDZ7_MALDO|nr:hypothetical protein DVH24_015995 [Malus domestica]